MFKIIIGYFATQANTIYLQQRIRYLLVVSLLMFLTNCKNHVRETTKLSTQDPFNNTMARSQFFMVDANQDQVVEGQDGTTVVVPKGCFKNMKGETVTSMVRLELAEAISLDDMLLSNLTTMCNGKPLETDGMIYFNATANDEQLIIDKKNPVYIEVPTAKRKDGMMAYKGLRDEHGNMNWVEPQELEKFLIPGDINLLDFLPEGFAAEVQHGMPFRNHAYATQQLIDSLYYSLSFADGQEFTQDWVITDLNEPYYTKNNTVKGGKYASDSSGIRVTRNDKEEQLEVNTQCRIDPAIIKVIKNKKFQNTLLATREFESRLKTIFKTCNNKVIESYIKNLDKNLWELDSMAAEIIKDSQPRNYELFRAHYNQRLTKVKTAGNCASLLRTYYEQRLSNIKAELENVKAKMIKALGEKNKAAQQMTNEYKAMLWKREKYRMEAYGLSWSDTGWINIDNGTRQKEWAPQPLEVVIENGQDFDHVYSYVIYQTIKSLYRLNTSDQAHFYAGNKDDNEMLMPKKKAAIVVSIAYKNSTPYVGIAEFETTTNQSIALKLSKSSLPNIRKKLSAYDTYTPENRIENDMAWVQQLEAEKKRQKRLQNDFEFFHALDQFTKLCCPVFGE